MHARCNLIVKLISMFSYRVKGSLILETDVSSSYEINVEASLHWPSLLPNTTISFPTTLVGNTSVSDTCFIVHNVIRSFNNNNLY